MALPAEVLRLQHEISRMQRSSAQVKALPVNEALTTLFPDGGLRPGATYSIEPSMGLLIALLSTASKAGSWCAAVGLPEFASETAAHAGVDLARFALVPDPGDRWSAVVSAIAEVVPVIAVRPPTRLRADDLARLSARLRDRGSVLLCLGHWPQAEQIIRIDDAQWSGLGVGHGVLTSRAVTVSSTGRRMPTPRRVRVLLPGAAGQAVAPAEAPVAIQQPRPDARPHLRAVV